MKGFWVRFAWYLPSVCFFLVVGEKGVLKKICYVSICCFVHEPEGILQCSLDALYRGATEDFCSVFRYSWEGFETNRGLRGCFLLPGGDKGVSLKVLFCSWRFLQLFLDALCRSTCVFCRVLSIFLEDP